MIEIEGTGFLTRMMNEDVDSLLKRHIDGFGEYRDAWNNASPDHIPDFPVHVDLELVDFCNQNCVFCPRNRRTHPDLPYELNTKMAFDDDMLRKLYSEVEENGLYSVNFGFGEPLIYKKVFEVVATLHELGVVDSRLVTNGLLLDRFMDEIFDSGLVNLYVSIDAFSEEVYRKQRGEGYNKVVDNLLRFLEIKQKKKSLLPITRVSFVETEENKHQLADFKAFWADKVNVLDIQFYQDFNKKRPDWLKQPRDQALDARRENGGPDTQRELEANKTTTRNKKWNCIDPFRRLAITANGDVLPCCAFYGKQLVLGNFKESTLLELWNSDRLSEIRSNLMNDKEIICLTCQEC